MLLAEVVAAARAVAETSSRNGKLALIADLLRRADAVEIEAAVGFLSGEPCQGRIGVGWATAYRQEIAPAAVPSLTVGDLDDALTRILATTGPGSVGSRGEILASLFARATADEADFVRRLFTGEMRQGALDGVVTEAVARAAGVPSAAVRRAVMLSGNLGRSAAVALREGEAGLDAIGLEVLRPVQPMLAGTAKDVAEALGATGPASVEWKLDGIRIQAHRAGDAVRIFTRNLNEITERLPAVAATLRGFPSDRFVLDGEAIAFDESERPLLFGETMSSVGGRVSEPLVSTTALFFDCLHTDGDDLIDRPLSERLAVVDRIAAGARIPGIATDDPAAAKVVFEESLAAGHEGVMVKS